MNDRRNDVSMYSNVRYLPFLNLEVENGSIGLDFLSSFDQYDGSGFLVVSINKITCWI